jgi:phosphoribosylcarboxyaminoimidazole (NCAIR) mutase
MAVKVPIISGSKSDELYVNAIRDSLSSYSIESEWHAASAHKEYENVMATIALYDEETIPIVTSAGRSDALSGTTAHRSPNPVISSRPDWKDPDSLKLYFFSTLGMPSLVAPGTVLGPAETASYVKKLIDLRENPPESDEIFIPLYGYDNELASKFTSALTRISHRIKTGKCDYDDIRGDAPVSVIFEYRSTDGAIDRILKNTDSPVILSPPTSSKKMIREKTFESFDRGYNPPVAMVLDPSNAALFAVTVLGLYDKVLRKALFAYTNPKRAFNL